MTALLLDTSQTLSILGLSQGGKLLSSRFLEGKSPSLLPVLDSFCDLKEILYVSVGNGPGSYMGIRTAATIAKTLSYALKIPLVEFPSPLAFLPEEEGIYSIIGDAKMGQLYTMKIEVKGGRVKSFTSPFLISADDPFHLGKESILDLRNLPKPNLHWVCTYTHEQFIKGNILSANELKLSYLR